MNNIIIFYTILLIIIMYILASTIENFQTTPAGPTDQIKDAVKQIYLADVESIRNLSAVATNLQKDGGLVTPANMSIRGKLSVGSAADIKTSLVDLLVENPTAPTTVTLKTKLDDNNITLTNTEGAFKISNKTVDLFNINKDGNVMKNGLTTASLTTTGDIIAKGKADITGALTSGTFTTGAINIVAATGAAATSLATGATGAATGAAATGATGAAATGATGAATGATIPTTITPTSITASNLIATTITTNGINIHDYTPIVFIFDAITTRDGQTNYIGTHERTFVFSQPSIAMCLWNEGTNNWNGGTNDRFWWLLTRMNAVMALAQPKTKPDNRYYRYCRHANDHSDYRLWQGISVSVPPGKMVKVFGGLGGELQIFKPGFTEIALPFSPHLVWAGLEAYKDHIPDTLDLSKKTGW
jgi:hypothetical protein